MQATHVCHNVMCDCMTSHKSWGHLVCQTPGASSMQRASSCVYVRDTSYTCREEALHAWLHRMISAYSVRRMSGFRGTMTRINAQQAPCSCAPLANSPISSQLFFYKHSRQVSAAVMADRPAALLNDVARPDADGRFGKFGGKYVPETLIPPLLAFTAEYEAAMKDEAFQVRTT